MQRLGSAKIQEIVALQPTDLLEDTQDPRAREIITQLEAGNAGSALAAAKSVIAKEERPSDALFAATCAMKKSGKQRDVVKILNKALEIGAPERADHWTLLGMCHRDLAEPEKAEAALAVALTQNPGYAPARYQRAIIRQERGRLGEAVEDFAQYLKTSSGSQNALAWSLFGVALRNLDRHHASASAIEKAIALDPDDIPARNALVITHHLGGNEEAAVSAGRIALGLKDRAATKAFREMDKLLYLKTQPAVFNAHDKAKNIISFSLWGDQPVYTHGAIVNAQIAPHLYPSWRCRFYCDETVPSDVRAELVRLGSEIVMICDPKLEKLKPLWRFLASDDDQIDRFICRDADSRLNAREAVAVDAWLKSGQPFHVMRDHVYHMEVMLAGMWGGVAGMLPNIAELADYASTYGQNRWNDQEFLRDIVWPLIRDHCWGHDSIYAFRGARDFPPFCDLPGKIHVGGAIKQMPAWAPPKA